MLTRVTSCLRVRAAQQESDTELIGERTIDRSGGRLSNTDLLRSGHR